MIPVLEVWGLNVPRFRGLGDSIPLVLECGAKCPQIGRFGGYKP